MQTSIARVAAIAVIAACVATTSCRDGHAREPGQAIPRVTAPIKIDGEWNEPDWSKTALRGQFLGDDRQLARPSSEVRLLRDDHTLYVGLYAADDDIRSTDGFRIEIGSRTWTVSALGTLAPAIAGAEVAVDRDGTVDDAANNDEEWVIELAVPLAAIGVVPGEPGAPGVPVHVRAARCDTPKHQPTRCGAWAGTVEPE